MSSGKLNGKLITKYREATGAEYGALAADIGVSPSLVRQMEDGYYPRRNSTEIIEALAKRLGCSVGALVIPAEAKKAS